MRDLVKQIQQRAWAGRPEGGRDRGGFTLMEMLIVIAIIAVLIAVAIPLFTSQLENAKRAADEANARSGYAAVLAEVMTSPPASTTATYVFDAAAGVARAGSGAVTGYGQSSQPADYEVAGIAVSGTAEGNYVTYTVRNGQITGISWGGSYGSLWNAISGKTISGDDWWGYTNELKASKLAAINEVLKTSNAERLAADKDILNSIASYFNSLTAEEAQAILGSQYDKMTNGKSARLFEYYIDGAYSIRVTPDGATNNTSYFTNLGYSPRIYESGNKTEGAFTVGKYNYTDTLLFTSDEVIGTPGKTGAHGVQMSFKVVDGKLTETKVWVNGTNVSSDVK